MTTHPFSLTHVHPSWRLCLEQALTKLDVAYVSGLSQSQNWLPGPQHIFNAFSLPIDEVNYVLIGESPYPRQVSANGYAFWDADVAELWSPSGLSKKVNRATSLRNIIKMLLVAEGQLRPTETGQEAISNLNKAELIQTNEAFFQNLLAHGFLLLNASLVLHTNSPQKDARAWLPFTQEILIYLLKHRPQVKFILLGRIAITIDKILPTKGVDTLQVEHPYNISFITNEKVLDFFRPLQLLRPKKE